MASTQIEYDNKVIKVYGNGKTTTYPFECGPEVLTQIIVDRIKGEVTVFIDEQLIMVFQHDSYKEKRIILKQFFYQTGIESKYLT